jgi:hypothetical protein
MWKTKTQTKGVNTANNITLTSPNSKHLFVKQYLWAATGTDGPAATVTLQIVDEDSNVLWEDAVLIGVTNENTGPFRMGWTFPGKGLPIKAGKNVSINTIAAGAATGSELSILYDI